jgi:glycine cleavage system H lipoate-binding protein
MKTNQARTKQPLVYSLDNDQCVWSRAGVIKPTKCINTFDCLECAMDQRVLANFEVKRNAAGKTDYRSAKMLHTMYQGKCRHMLSGRISYGLCSHGYNCVKCPFDQMIEDTSYLPNLKPPVVDAASGFNVARDHYFHFGHTWARVEYGGRVRVGIDDFALRLLGPQDEIEVPGLGSRVRQNDSKAVLKRNGKEAPTLSPIDGKVLAINYKVLDKPALANEDPYGEGWLMVIQPDSLRSNLKNLFFGPESLGWIEDEVFRLRGRIHEVLGEEDHYQIAATGGEALTDIYGEVPEIGWDYLVAEFLHSKR